MAVRWTKKRVKETNWMVGGRVGAYPFSVVDPASTKTMALCSTKVHADGIILERKALGYTEYGQ